MSDNLDVRTIARETSPADTLRRYWYLFAVLVIAIGAYVHWWRYYAFNDIGYAPLQPVPYSHQLHAGELGIDCQYCHFNAERGKHAGVPPVSVCLGCHAPDQGMAAQDRPGVQKLLELTSTETGLYADDNDYDGTSEGVAKAGGVIHWNRVHKLPDHAYFSHEWHVEAGVSCQTCHGPVETMEVVEQFASLEMGWCIECHRDDSYVGGRAYDGSAETFAVGTANYDIIRQRIRPDDIVHFEARPTRGVTASHDHDHDHPPSEYAGEPHAADVPSHEELRGLFDESKDTELFNRSYFSDAQREKLQELFARYQGPDGRSTLPRWRIPNLPETHALFYVEGADADGDGRIDDPDLLKDPAAFGTFQNAPTDCSTCHQ